MVELVTDFAIFMSLLVLIVGLLFWFPGVCFSYRFYLPKRKPRAKPTITEKNLLCLPCGDS